MASIAFFLALPMLLSAIGRPTRSDAYRSLRPTSGPYRHIEHEVVEETKDVDMAFAGPSTVYAGIDARVVKDGLREALGRDATVFAVGHNWNGLDVTFAVLKDLLEHRKVRTVVLMFPTELEERDAPHPMAYRVLDYRHHAASFASLPLHYRAELYGDLVLGAPRHLLSVVRRNRDDADPAPQNLGSINSEEGFDGAPFVAFSPPPKTLAAADMIAEPGAAAPAFDFGSHPLSPFEDAFARKIVELTKEHHTRLVAIAMPFISDAQQHKVQQRFDWRAAYGIPVIGVPPATLFAGQSEQEMQRLYYNSLHMNVNGAQYFTRTILPALVKLHDK